MSDGVADSWEEYRKPLRWGFGAFTFLNMSAVSFPHWFADFLFLALAVSPWIRMPNRFSLRTLLIACTLVSVLLGALLVAAR
jgi:hypothetical protein